jgi:hypothetical protein
MATRMQQRRGTASQWVSSNDGDGPTLNAGEIGFETDTNKFKIGDGVSAWADLAYFADAPTLGGSIDDYIPLTQKGVANGVAELDGSGKLASAQIPNIDEITQDILDTALVAGTGLDKTYNDNAGTYTMDIDSTVATLTGSQTLTNKTLTSPVISTISNTGTLTLPTSTGTVALTSDITTAINNLVDGAPGALDTLNELAAALGDDASYASTITTALGLKAPLADPTFTGTATIPTLSLTNALSISNGGTGQTTAMAAATALLPDQSSNSGKYLTNDGTGTLSWGTVTGYSAPTLGSTSIASGATVTTIVGLTKVRSDQFTTLDGSGYEVDIEIMQIMGAF